jgi:transposase
MNRLLQRNGIAKVLLRFGGARFLTVEEQIDGLTDKLEQISASDAGCCRIRQIPGIGPIVATAIVAAICNGAAFRKGRDFAAWLA